MINAIPFIGWVLSVGVAISMAIPFWFFWTINHVGEIAAANNGEGLHDGRR